MARFCALFALLLFLTIPAGASAAPSSAAAWRDASGIPAPARAGARPQVAFDRFRALRLDHAELKAALGDGPRAEVSLPAPDGTFRRFELQRTTLMEPRLAQAHPEIRTYRGRGIDDPRTTIHLTQTPAGVDASVRGPRGAWYVNPYYQRDKSLYASYYGRDLPEDVTDFVEREPIAPRATAELVPRAVAGPSVSLRTYRIALLNDHTYATYFGSANVLAAKVTLINRVNQVYEDDFAVRMVLIDGTPALNLDTQAKMTGTNGPCGANACFSAAQATDCGGALDRTMYVIGQLAGARNYDIGHIALGTNGGGIAYLGVVGTDYKAGGCTGVTTPKGDLYAVDYFAHEVGHQFGGNHTFDSLDCSGNRHAATAVEPGSGSSIMAYAGICGDDDLQPHSDPYFSQRSLDEVTAYVTSVQPAVQEIQAVSLTGFGAGDSYTLTYNGSTTSPITSTTNANTLRTLIQGITGRTVTVSGLSNGGYSILFSGTTAADMLSVTNATGMSGYVGETQHGGPAANGGTPSATGNRAPVVELPASAYTIPRRTPFALTGSATDEDGDALTYLWEQNDPAASAEALFDQTKNGPLFRQFGTYADVSAAGTLQSPSPGENAATGNPTRVFPDLAQVVAGNTNAATGTCPTTPVATARDCFSEFLPTVARVLHFRLTARDGNAAGGGTGKADATVTVTNTGPFRVTSQATATTANSSAPLTVTWDVASTDLTPISAANVRISLSTDGGVTFPHELAASTPNDGTQSVTLPAISTTQARLKVEAVGNVFFAVNAANFTISATPTPTVTNNAPGGQATVQYSDSLPAVTVSATDSDTPGASLTAVAAGLPAGVALTANAASGNSRTWTVAGTTTAAPGSYPVTVTVDDGDGHSAQTSFTIVVTAENASVAYSGDTNVASPAQTHLAASVTAAADGSPGDTSLATVTFKEGATTLCANVPVSAGSASCDVALSAGAHTIALTVGGRFTGSGSGSVTVVAASPTASNDAGTGGRTVQYSDPLASALTITASDADTADSALSASATGLPAGMALTRASAAQAVWTVTGTATGALGAHEVTVTVSDGVRTAQTQFTITVTAEDASIVYSGDTSGTAGTIVHLAADVSGAADGTPGDTSTATVTFNDGASPLCTDRPVVAGTATCDVTLASGDHTISLVAGGRYTGSGSGSVTVSPAPGSPDATNDAGAGRSVQYSDALASPLTITATDPDTAGSGLSAVASGLPAGMSLAVAGTTANGRTWTVAGATTAALGAHLVTVTVSDGVREAQTQFTIDVVAENATLTYTGDTSGTAGTPVHLAATVTEVPDGSPGSLSNATVTFKEGTTTLCTEACDVSLAAGTHSISVIAGGRYTGSGSGSVTVVAASPVASGGGARSVQYSDALSPGVTISADDADTADSALSASAAGLPAGLSLSRTSPAEAAWTVGGAVTAAPGAYPVTVTVSDGVRTDEEQFTITVTREDATATYSGDTQRTHPDQVHLAADLSSTSDGTPGDLTTARVTFKEGDTPLCDDVPVSGGSASCDVALGLGDHTITMTVGGRYTGTGTGTVSVVAAPVASSDGSRTVQYSDALDPTVTVSAIDADTAASALTASAEGLPAGMSLTRPLASAATWTVAGATTAALGSYPVTVTVSDGTRTDQAQFTIDVVAEAATVAYTGDTSGTAGTPVHLAATVAEVPDGSPGSLSNATLTFKEGTTILCTAECDVLLAAGSHAISMTVGGRYSGSGNGSVDIVAPPAPVGPVASDDAVDGRAAAQYSDPLARTVTVTASDGDTAPSQLTASAAGLPRGLTLSRTAPGEASWTVAGAADDALGDYPVTVTVGDGDADDATSFTVSVVAEDADVTALTGGPTAVQATVHDRADGAPGDLAHARVTYRAGAATLCSDLTVAASCAVELAAGTHAITALVGGRYTGSGGADVAVTAPAKPATLKPDLALVRKRLKVSRTGRVALKLRCAPTTLVDVPARCAGRVVLKARGRTVGKRAFDIGSASGGTVRVKLSRRGLRMRRVRLTMTVLNPGDAPSVASKSFALRRIR